MPKGPEGQERPADTVAAAIVFAKIATGEIEEMPKKLSSNVRSGKADIRARAERMAAADRSSVARMVAAKRCA